MDIDTILVVDDAQSIRDMVAEMLEDRAEKIISAENGEEALKVLAEVGKVDVVITDMKMPGINGLQLLERIKKTNPAISVIIMTGYSEIFSAEEAMKKGADEYILKPFKKDEINVFVTRARQRAASVYKKRLLEGINLVVEYVTVANKVITASIHPSPHKEKLLAMGEEIKKSITQIVTDYLEQVELGGNSGST